MKQEVADVWTEALDSEEYEQGKYVLHEHGLEGKPDKFCCLGVLCDVYIKTGHELTKKLNTGKDRYMYGEDESGSYLPQEVMDWAGMKNQEGYLPHMDSENCSLSRLNDNNHSFKYIAQVIKENVEAL